MRAFLLVISLLVLFSGSAVASSTACQFSGTYDEDLYEIEFIGHDDRAPLIVFSSTASGGGRRIALPAAHYELKTFDSGKQAVALRFTNPGNPSLPPSFTFDASGEQGILRIGSRRITGQAGWSF